MYVLVGVYIHVVLGPIEQAIHIYMYIHVQLMLDRILEQYISMFTCMYCNILHVRTRNVQCM